MPDTFSLSELIKDSGISFGTSGVRGLQKNITDSVVCAFTKAFLQQIRESFNVSQIAVGSDLRASSPRIKKAAILSLLQEKIVPIDCGQLPSPALAYYGLKNKIPTIMITGSHIPEDRNGIKFTTPLGEISKEDERKILAQQIPVNLGDNRQKSLFDDNNVDKDLCAYNLYLNRYRQSFPSGILQNLHVILYEHSTVGKQAFKDVLTSLGAIVDSRDASTTFIPVDTEAIREEDIVLAKTYANNWTRKEGLAAIISADGDADRPLIADETGDWLRGDSLGILVAHFLTAQAVVTPVSSSTALEKTKYFNKTLRTKIGSPHVIEGITQLVKNGFNQVVGYEANGGFLTGSTFFIDKTLAPLEPLPTRDALLPILCLLVQSLKAGKPISHLLASLPPRVTASSRLKNIPTSVSLEFLAELEENEKTLINHFPPETYGKIIEVDNMDGLRLYFTNNDIIHLRPSGNAPELRVYVETDKDSRSNELLLLVIKQLALKYGANSSGYSN